MQNHKLSKMVNKLSNNKVQCKNNKLKNRQLNQMNK